MSWEAQFHFDEGSQRWMEYDHSQEAWVYRRDNIRPSQYIAPSGTVEGSSRSYDQPRSFREEDATAAYEQEYAAYGDNSASSPPRASGYTTATTNELVTAFSQNNLNDFCCVYIVIDLTLTDEALHTDHELGVAYAGKLVRSPKQDVTDPELFQKGALAHGRIYATPGESELLDSGYKKQPTPRRFFVEGRVFRILWPEQPGNINPNVTVITDVKFENAEIVTKIRWPISTYSERGCGKKGIKKWQHSIAHTGRESPALLPREAPREGEAGMMTPIRVEPARKGHKMHNASRIDYSRMYTVEHYVKVKEFGMVHERYLKTLKKQWWYVMKRNTDGEVEEEPEPELEPAEQPASTYREWVTAKAVFYQDKMMTLQVGDRIGVTGYTNEHWWMGVNLRSNEHALFPSSYVTRDA